MNLTGRTLASRFRVERQITSTWMSSIWAATDEEKDTPVRIRIPDERLLKIPGFAAAAFSELQEITRHRATSVQTVIASGLEEGVPFSVLKGMEGGSLADRLEGGPVEMDFVSSWLETIAAALDRMHEREIVHRDVSAESIVIDDRGNAEVADAAFAVALAATAPDHGPPVSSPGELGDLPPELLEHRFGPAYDQYCLAAVVFRCLAGRAVQPSDSYLGAGQAVADRLPAEAIEVLERALSVVPGSRFSSCGAFAATFLEAAGAATPGMDRTGTLMIDARDLARAVAPREEATDIPLASPLPPDEDLSAEVDPARLTGEIPAAPRPRPVAVPPPRRSAARWLVPLVILLLAGGGGAAWWFLGRTPGGAEKPTETATGGGAEKPPVEPGGEPGGTPVAIATVSITEPENGKVVGAGPIVVRGHISDGEADRVQVNKVTVTPGEDGTFTAPVALAPGENELTATAWRGDAAGMPDRILVVSDGIAPVIEDPFPGDGFATRDVSVEVSGRVADDHPESAVVNGAPVPLDPDGSFHWTVDLPDDETTIRIVGRDRAGNESATVEIHVLRDATDPVVRLESPAAGTVTSTRRVFVKGTLEDAHPDRVLVDGKTVEAPGWEFREFVELIEGPNLIVVRGFDRAGNDAVAEREVILDTTPPKLVLDERPEGEWVRGRTVTITGRVEDATSTVVSAGGEPVPVGSDRKFSLTVPLDPGRNRIEVIATDEAGNPSAPARRTYVRSDIDVTLQVHRPDGKLYTTAEKIVITGSVSPAGATVTAGGTRAAVDGTAFRVEVPLAPGQKDVEVVAELPGAEPVRDVFPIVRPRPGDPIAGPAKLVTAAEEMVLLEESAVLTAGPADEGGRETFRLSAGTISCILGDRTRLDLPVGYISVEEGRTTGIRATAGGPDSVGIVVTSGQAIVLAPPDRIFVGNGQQVTLRATSGGLMFSTEPGNEGTVGIVRQAAPDVIVRLDVSPGTTGMIRVTTKGEATGVSVGTDSTGSLTLKLYGGGFRDEEPRLLAAGASYMIPHRR